MGRFIFPSFLSFWILAAYLVFPPAAGAQNTVDWTQPGDTIEETEGRGLLIRSNPVGAEVYIDGINRGYTPLRVEDIRPGNYVVRLRKDGFSERRFRLSARAGSMVSVSIELKQAIGRVIVKIQGAPGSPGPDMLPLVPQISVDGRSFPQPAMELPVGFRNITVRAFGWEDASVTLFVEEGSLYEPELNMKPASFKAAGAGLSRSRFNPANAGSLGTTAVNFTVSGPGKGSFTVLDPGGKTVLTRPLDAFATWSQSAVWNGRDSQGEILGDGIYTLVVKASSIPWDNSAPAEDTIEQKVEIDSSHVIYPLSISSGKSGLLFAPLPSLLPPGSFQIEGSLLAGSPPGTSPWKGLPFAVAARFSPLSVLEVSAALNVDPYFNGGAEAGAGGSVKWLYLRGDEGGLPFGAAAGLAGSWTGKSAITPFGMASGIEAYFPFKLDFGGCFTVTLSPAALWTGDEGFPWEPVPRLLVYGGVMLQMTHFNAGLSVRQEYNFLDRGRPSIIAGGELRFFPPPSNFVFSANGGLWAKGGSIGGFGGIGIGIIY